MMFASTPSSMLAGSCGLVTLTLVLALCSGVAEAQCFPQETAKVIASDGNGYQMFGRAVSLDGNTLVVGAHRDDDNGPESGSAYVYQRESSGDNWVQVAKLLPYDGGSRDEFGCSVSISGNTIVIGAFLDSDLASDSGSAYVFEREPNASGNWTQVAKLHASDFGRLDLFGTSVAVSGSTCIVGAPWSSQNEIFTGAAYVFERDQGGQSHWGQVAKLLGSGSSIGDFFGEAVAISGSTVIIGATGEDLGSPQAGAAYIFERDAGGPGHWGEVAALFATDGSMFDQFGRVAISKDTVVVGAFTDDQNGLYAGSAYIFERNHGGSGNWGQVAKLLPLDSPVYDHFGLYTSISDDTVVVGAPFDADNGFASGAAYVFYRDMGGMDQWGQVAKIYQSEAEQQDYFGVASISGDTIAVGAQKNWSQGAAYIFDNPFVLPPMTYCSAGPSSFPDCVPAIQSIGVPSATAWSGFTLQTRNVPGQSVGVFLYTHDGAAQSVFGDVGRLCISSQGLFVAGPVISGGALGACDGFLEFDWNWHAQYVVLTDPLSTQAGTTVDGQFWYRDPALPATTSLTNAIGFVICR